jgi:hypothetical protein
VCCVVVLWCSSSGFIGGSSNGSSPEISLNICRNIKTQIDSQIGVVKSKEMAIQDFFKQKSRNPTKSRDCVEFKQLYDAKKNEEQKLNLLYVHQEFFERVSKKK